VVDIKNFPELAQEIVQAGVDATELSDEMGKASKVLEEKR